MPSVADPSEADPSEADPSEADPSEADPSEADPSEADPSEADPSEAESSEAESSEAYDSDDSDDSEDEDEKLDTSWVEEFKEAEYNYNAFYKAPLTSIKLYLLYIDKNKEIVSVDTTRCALDAHHKIKHERIFSLVKYYQTRESVNYKLNALLRYNIDLNPDDILDFLNEEDLSANERFMTFVKYSNDIHYNDSIHFFKKLNALYFIFMEDTIQPSSHHLSQTKRIKMTTKHHKTMRNSNKKNLKITKEIS
jgi:hypothetical protein